MPETENIQITLENYDNSKTYFDFDNIIYDLDSEIDLLPIPYPEKNTTLMKKI
ncbi:hypothetical protein FPV25_09240 [Carnobacterium sp. PL17GRE32]|uniref:hypothetical protein n=1 Tax=Carnobacterium sp. PL17GRE32 TaxID=2592355 RepID=UPI0013FB56C8|nr:hypothetical protein [Carnobacterium sp. PL17GRE32]KAF3303927.1 hypothetical protein FPV25_09240 [Carnobacterium sp. PL17GRE32]